MNFYEMWVQDGPPQGMGIFTIKAETERCFIVTSQEAVLTGPLSITHVLDEPVVIDGGKVVTRYVVLEKAGGKAVGETRDSLAEAIFMAQAHDHLPENAAPNPAPPLSKADNHTLVQRLGDHILDFYAKVECPECGLEDTIYNLIQHLNDGELWAREAIADWLETLDLDLTIQQDKVRDRGTTKATVLPAAVHWGPAPPGSVSQEWKDEATEMLAKYMQIPTQMLALPEDKITPPQKPDLEMLNETLAALKVAAKDVSAAINDMHLGAKNLLETIGKAIQEAQKEESNEH